MLRRALRRQHAVQRCRRAADVPTDFCSSSSKRRAETGRCAFDCRPRCVDRAARLGHALPQGAHFAILGIGREPVRHRLDEAAAVDDAVVDLAVQRHAAVGEAIDDIELPEQAAALERVSCSSQTVARSSSIEPHRRSVSRWTCRPRRRRASVRPGRMLVIDMRQP